MNEWFTQLRHVTHSRFLNFQHETGLSAGIHSLYEKRKQIYGIWYVAGQGA